VRSLYQWDVRDFLKLVDDYNRATKRGKLAAELRLPFATDSDTFFAQVKPEIYKEARMKSAADFGRFQRDIRRNIDEGIPLSGRFASELSGKATLLNAPADTCESSSATTRRPAKFSTAIHGAKDMRKSVCPWMTPGQSRTASAAFNHSPDSPTKLFFRFARS
jgi:hypothetical protein